MDQGELFITDQASSFSSLIEIWKKDSVICDILVQHFPHWVSSLSIRMKVSSLEWDHCMMWLPHHPNLHCRYMVL
jgi:hypothetical protein